MADDDDTGGDGGNGEVDLEPIIRKIVQDENKTTGEKIDALSTKVDGITGLKDELEGLFKKNRSSGGAKLDEDGLVAKIKDALTSEGNGGGGNDGGNGDGTTTKTGRKPGPLSRFLGIS